MSPLCMQGTTNRHRFVEIQNDMGNFAGGVRQLHLEARLPGVHERMNTRIDKVQEVACDSRQVEATQACRMVGLPDARCAFRTRRDSRVAGVGIDR